MFRRALGFGLLLFVLPAWGAPTLPLKRMQLYDSGVAYYERAGRVDARGASLPVPAGHLDDVLKTLVVLSNDGGRLAGIDFSSSVSKAMARTLAGLPAEATQPIGYDDLLSSLKGAHLRVTTAHESFDARLVDLQEEQVVLPVPVKAGEGGADKDRPPPVQQVKDWVLLVLTDSSEVRRIHARDVVSVRPTEGGFAARLGAALDALSAHGAQTERALHVSGSARAVTLGYIAEAPLWRTTYRLVLAKDGSNILQGWALLHNDTDEDWNQVRVELVNGHPDSFLYPLAVPRYASRSLVTPENELSTVPQLLDTTADALWGDHVEGGSVSSAYGDTVMGISGHGSGGGGLGIGSIGTVGHGSGAQETSSDMLEVGHLAPTEDAEGVEAGALFTYRLAEPLTLRARASALVPFLQRRVKAERITWISSVSADPRASVDLVNDTDQTLPGGPLSVFSAGGFSGEATVDRLKPGERRVVEFGSDLDVVLSQDTPAIQEEVKRLVFRRDQLEEHYLRTTQATQTLENRSGQPRSVHVGLQLEANAQVRGADAIDFDPQTHAPVAVFQAGPRTRTEHALTFVEGLSRRTALKDLTSARLRELAAAPGLPDADRKGAKEAAARQAALEAGRERLAQAKAETQKVEQDIQRLQGHLRAAGTGSAPIVQRVLAAEDHLEVLKKDEARREAELAGLSDAVKAALLPLEAGPAVSAR
jgi:hypothetical protein